jgi:hypothetical protein
MPPPKADTPRQEERAGWFAISVLIGSLSPYFSSRWLKTAEETKRTLAAHNAAVRESLNRIEATLKQQSKTSQP